MLSQRKVDILVGLFLLLATLGLMVLAFKVSGLTSFFKPNSYVVTAQFDDIGQLKVRSPIKMGGVVIGEVSAIELDPSSFKAIVKMSIERRFNEIPDDSMAGILTAGLLGDNYIEIVPMYGQTFLKNGSEIEDTHSAMILEKLIGQLVYKLGSSDSSKSSDSAKSGGVSKPNNTSTPTEKNNESN